ncbi:Ger(x)C family spore germination protein [Clostridium sp. A1-XYC3]|uniref:Ger(X)C family spore germination protein n=1 Tax=Clostridium tanneri TaxID=3037988 RepID=A0ABU4JVT6_9CLOT|nr:Ger(x)C family spore germination protein [Clostridium sp. A1-XYC3]MDW8802034.1 Ger(x)C family spore germination protein [Clostridium sp. A1-XYC3]
MKKILLCFLILTTVLFSGCFNYRDIDKVLFVTAVIVDIDGNGDPILYIEAFKPSRGGQGSSGKGERVLFEGTGKTIFEIVRDINLSSSYKLNYTQNRGIIFTEKAAEKGLENFIDFFDRDQELVIRADIAIFKGDPKSLLNSKLKEQEYIGLFIHDLIYNISASSRGVVLRLNDFLNKMYTRNNIAVITTIAIKKDQPEDKIEVSDAAILRDCKLVDMLDRRQGEGYNFLMDNIKGGTLEVTNPDAPNKFITLEILNSKTITKINYDGKTVHLKKIINTRTSIGEAQDKLIFSKDKLNKISNNAEKNISRECTRIYEEYKKKNLDILNIEEEFSRKYPKKKIDNVLLNSQLELEVHVEVEGSADKMDFRYGGK